MKSGFRTEIIYGSGYRDPVEVLTYEVNNLCNIGILEYLAMKTVIKNSKKMSNKLLKYAAEFGKYSEDDWKKLFNEAIEEIYKLTGKRLTECIWLTDTKEDLIFIYLTNHGDESCNIEWTDNDIDEYCIDDSIILADIGKAGKLYEFDDTPIIKMETITRLEPDYYCRNCSKKSETITLAKPDCEAIYLRKIASNRKITYTRFRDKCSICGNIIAYDKGFIRINKPLD